MGRPAFRLRMFAGRSVDATEQTLLTPAAGAPHSDPFAYATVRDLRANILDVPMPAANIARWSASNGGVVTLDPTNPFMGQASAKVVTGTGAVNVEGVRVNMAATTYAPVVAGRAYCFSAWVDGSSIPGGKNLAIRCYWRDASLTVIGTAANLAFSPAGLSWARYSNAAMGLAALTAPAGAVWVDLRVDEVGASATQYTFWVSAAMLEDVTDGGAVPGIFNDRTEAYRPHMDHPRGRKNTLDVKNRKLKGGSISFELSDPPVTAGNNAQRHVTAFLGTATGQPQVLGLKVEVDRCADVDSPTGEPWVRWWTGRAEELGLAGLAGVLLDSSDLTAELELPCFVGVPHSSVTYAKLNPLWPVGPGQAMGSIPRAYRVPGVVSNATIGPAGGRSVIISSGSTGAKNNRVTDAMVSQDVPVSDFGGFPSGSVDYNTDVRAYLYPVAGGAATVHTVGGVGTQASHSDDFIGDMADIKSGGFRVTEVLIGVVPGGGGDAIPANGTQVYVELTNPVREVDEAVPLLVDGAHVVQYLADLVDGKFSRLKSDGSVTRAAMPREATSWAALLADSSLRPLVRRVIAKKSTVNAELESVCKQYSLGVRINPLGELVLVDLRLPTSLAGVPTLTDADVVPTTVSWSMSRAQAVTAFDLKWYLDVGLSPTSFQVQSGVVTYPNAALMKSYERPVLVQDFGRLDLGDNALSIDLTCFRSSPQESTDGVARDQYIRGELLKLTESYRNPFGYGPWETQLKVVRNATTEALAEGSLVFTDVSWLPNPGTNQRGGARLARVYEVQDDGPDITLSILDLGPNATLQAPTVGALALEGGNNSHGVTVAITLNGSNEPVALEYAVTAASVATVGAVPDSAWRRFNRVTTSATYTIKPVGAGKRIWVRARTEVATLGVGKLPSGWQYATPNFVTTTAISSPTAMAVGSITQKRATLSWSVGSNSTDLVALLLCSPSGGTPTFQRFLAPGTTTYTLEGTVSGDTYKAAVAFWDGHDFTALSGTVTWTATGTPVTAPTPLAISVYEPELP